jgi:hypothetical protein
MKNKFALYVSIIAVALLGSGCESTGVSSRINENAAVFAALTPDQQKRIQAGAIDFDFTSDMVYMALGKPSSVKASQSPEGAVELWTYKNFIVTTSASELTVNGPSGNSTNWSSTQHSTQSPAAGGRANSAAGLGSTTQSGPKTELGFADLPTDTLNIYLKDGKVVRVSLESVDGPAIM